MWRWLCCAVSLFVCCCRVGAKFLSKLKLLAMVPFFRLLCCLLSLCVLPSLCCSLSSLGLCFFAAFVLSALFHAVTLFRCCSSFLLSVVCRRRRRHRCLRCMRLFLGHSKKAHQMPNEVMSSLHILDCCFDKYFSTKTASSSIYHLLVFFLFF